jgi:hypothetical protein
VTVLAGFACDVFVDPAGISHPFFGGAGLSFDALDNLYYTTLSGQTIVVVDSTGTPITTIDRSSIPHAFPWDVVFDSTGILFHSDVNADSPGSFPDNGAVFRDPAAASTVIAQGFPNNITVPTGDPAGMDFPSPNNLGVGFSDGLYVANLSSGIGAGAGKSSGIFRIPNPATRTGPAGVDPPVVFLDADESASPAHPIVDACALAFGPGGAFGDDLYVTDPNICELAPAGFECNPAADPTVNDGAIYTVDWSANVTIFAGGTGGPLEDPADLVFSSGGAFGTLLYVTDTVTGKVLRMDSAGTVTDFATGLASPGALAFGPDGCLYIAEAGSGSSPNRIIAICEAVTPTPPPSPPAVGGIVELSADSTATSQATSSSSGRDYGAAIAAGVAAAALALTAGGWYARRRLLR